MLILMTAKMRTGYRNIRVFTAASRLTGRAGGNAPLKEGERCMKAREMFCFLNPRLWLRRFYSFGLRPLRESFSPLPRARIVDCKNIWREAGIGTGFLKKLLRKVESLRRKLFGKNNRLCATSAYPFLQPHFCNLIDPGCGSTPRMIWPWGYDLILDHFNSA